MQWSQKPTWIITASPRCRRSSRRHRTRERLSSAGTYSEPQKRSAAAVSAGRTAPRLTYRRTRNGRVALRLPLTGHVQSNLTPKHVPDLGAPLRNRTVDLLLTIGTAPRPQRTSCTDCTKICTESTERAQCARRPVHDPFHGTPDRHGHRVTLSDRQMKTVPGLGTCSDWPMPPSTRAQPPLSSSFTTTTGRSHPANRQYRRLSAPRPSELARRRPVPRTAPID